MATTKVSKYRSCSKTETAIILEVSSLGMAYSTIYGTIFKNRLFLDFHYGLFGHQVFFYFFPLSGLSRIIPEAAMCLPGVFKPKFALAILNMFSSLQKNLLFELAPIVPISEDDFGISSLITNLNNVLSKMDLPLFVNRGDKIMDAMHLWSSEPTDITLERQVRVCLEVAKKIRLEYPAYVYSREERVEFLNYYLDVSHASVMSFVRTIQYYYNELTGSFLSVQELIHKFQDSCSFRDQLLLLAIVSDPLPLEHGPIIIEAEQDDRLMFIHNDNVDPDLAPMKYVKPGNNILSRFFLHNDTFDFNDFISFVACTLRTRFALREYWRSDFAELLKEVSRTFNNNVILSDSLDVVSFPDYNAMEDDETGEPQWVTVQSGYVEEDFDAFEKDTRSKKKSYRPTQLTSDQQISAVEFGQTYLKRQAEQQKVKQELEASRAELQAQANKMRNHLTYKRAKGKAAARKQYQMRHTLAFNNVSPLLDLTIASDLSITQRVYEYSRRHKCRHRKMYNNFVLAPNQIVPYCDHDCERVIFKVDPKKCNNCGALAVYPVARSTCACKITFCNFCKQQLYYKGEEFSYMNFCDRSAEDWKICINPYRGANVKTKLPAAVSDIVFNEQLVMPQAGEVDEMPTLELTDVEQRNIDIAMERERKRLIHQMKKDLQPPEVFHDVQEDLPSPGLLGIFGDLVSFCKDKITGILARVKDAILNYAQHAVTSALGSALRDRIYSWLQSLESMLKKFMLYVYRMTSDKAVMLRQAIYDLLNAELADIPCRLVMFWNLIEPIPYDTTKSHFLMSIYFLITAIQSFTTSDDSEDEDDDDDVHHVRAQAGPDIAISFLKYFGEIPQFVLNYFNKDLAAFNTKVTACRNFASLLTVLTSFFPSLYSMFSSVIDTDYFFRLTLRDSNSIPTEYLTTCVRYNNAVLLDNKNDIAFYAPLVTSKRAETQKFIADKNLMSPAVKTFLELCIRLTRDSPLGNTRDKEPFAIKVSSAPGLGKSTFWPLFLTPLFDRPEGMDSKAFIQHILDSTFTRQPANEYWDGHSSKKHKIILYDDAFQDREEKDVMEIITVISKAAFAPNYAFEKTSTTDGKGSQAAPDYVVMLSNMDNYTPTSIHCSEALNRRKHINIVVKQISSERKPDLSHLGFEVEYYGERFVNQTLAQVYAHMKIAHTRYIDVNKKIEIELADLVYVHAQAGYDIREIISNIMNDKYHAFLAAASFIKEELKTFIQPYNSQFYYALGALATAVLGFIAYFRIRPKYKPQSGEVRTSKAARIVVRNAGLDQSVVSKIINNTVTLRYVQEGRVYKTTACYIHGNAILVPRHYFHNSLIGSEYIPEATEVLIDEVGTPTPLKFYFNSTRMFSLSDVDAVLYRLPNTIPAKASLVTQFNKADFGMNGRRVVCVRKNLQTKAIREISTNIIKDNLTVRYSINPFGKEVEYHQHSTFSYAADGMVGDCGSLILLENSLSPIIGFHIAHNGREAIGMIISSAKILEVIERCEAALGPIIARSEMPAVDKTMTEKVLANCGAIGTVEYIGKSNTNVFQSVKTSLRHSELHGKLTEPITAPSQLSFYDPEKLVMVDKRITGLHKYAAELPDLPEHLVAIASDSIFEDLNAIQSNVERRLLTEQEAINGIPGSDHINMIDMTTSPGYPFNVTGMAGPKRNLFDLCEDGSYKPTPILQQNYEHLDDLMQMNMTPDVYWTCTLKDERRPLAKVAKTRLFLAAPLSYTLLSRKYNLSFVAHFYHCAMKCFSSVGIDPESNDWHTMISRLLEVGQFGYGGDYGGWDGKIHTQIAESFATVVTRWMQDDWLAYRKWIILNLNQPFVIVGDKIFQFKHANTSGTDICVVYNTFCGEMYQRIAWMALVPPPHGTMYWYRQYVRTSIYGDDNLVTVYKPLLEYFNAVTFSQYLKKYGIDYTTADKGQVEVPYMELTSCTFLKRSIKKEGVLYKALFPKELAYEIVNWIRKTNNAEQATEDNCNAALRLLVNHGFFIFNTFRTKILSEKPHYNLITYADMTDKYFHTGTTTEFGVFTLTPGRVAPPRL